MPKNKRRFGNKTKSRKQRLVDSTRARKRTDQRKYEEHNGRSSFMAALISVLSFIFIFFLWVFNGC